MELSLNLIWLLLAALMLGLWLRFAPRSGSNQRMQLVALSVLILILFPVISVTDDLQAALNPAEVDSTLRRDHRCTNPHSIMPAVAALPPRVATEISFSTLQIAAPGEFPVRIHGKPALAPIQNRPPPCA
jgi:hypothetical protein